MKRRTFCLVVICLLAASSASQGASLVSTYNIYYGHVHNHSNLSDGTGTPVQAYSTAKAAGLDFFGLADHDYMLTTGEPQLMVDAANAYNQPGVFTTFWGFEWTSLNHGHVAVINYPTLAGLDYCTRDTYPTFNDLVTWLSSPSRNSVAFFNHPGRNNGSGTEFNHFTGSRSYAIVGMELWNKGETFSTFYYNGGYTSDSRDRSGYYDEALFNGWQIGASGSEDNHSGTWGSSNYRLAILAEYNTRDDLYSALGARRFYSTLDKNLQLSFRVNGFEMGSSIAGGSSQCVVEAADGDNEGFLQVEVIHNGDVVYIRDVAGQTHPTVTCDLFTQQGDYIYCKVTQNDGGEAISSPVFITSNGPDGPPRAALAVPLDNGPDDLEPANGQVTVNTPQPAFQIQLSDFEGINDGTVSSADVSIAGLTLDVDYAFTYYGDTDIITLAPLKDVVFGNGTYTITLSGISDLAVPPDTMAETILTILIDTSIVPPATLHFQQGLDGYGGTVDTMVRGAAAGTSYATSTIITTDLDDASGWPSHVLLRFDDIVGGAAGQIPPYATVISATLRLRSLDTGSGGSLHAMLQPWSDAATWNSLVNGIQADDAEAAIAADDGISANSLSDVDLDVTTRVQSWVDGIAVNNGWAVLANGVDGWDIASAEHSTADYRPELIVTFVATEHRLPVADAGSDKTVADDDGDNAELVTLDGSASYHPDPSVSIVSYAWTIDGVPVPPVPGDPDALISVEVSFGLGTHTAILTVTDSEGATDTDAVMVTVNANQPPTANAGGNRTIADVGGDGETVILNGRNSTDPDGGITTYAWVVDGTAVIDTDENPGDGIVSLTLALGSHTAQLTVTDNGLASDTDIAIITVEVPALFSEDFESGGFAAGGWVAGGQAIVETTSAHAGTYGVLLKKSSYIQTTIDTGGATGVTFTYWARTAGLKAGSEYLYVEWSQDGSTWLELNKLTGTTGWTQFSPSLSFTQPSFMIRFRTNGNAGGDMAMIDDIVVRAAGGSNHAPVALEDSAATNEDTPVTISVLANDTDDDGDTLSVISVTQGSQGGVTNNGTTVTYTPDENVNGGDSFTYTISDGKGDTVTATVTVTINPVDDPPVAANDAATTAKDTAVTIHVLANDYHVDGPLDVISTSLPAHGTAIVNADETITYTPAAGYVGDDSFSYTLAGGVTATVTVTVQGVAATMHVADLDGTGAVKGNSTQWAALVTVTVVNQAGPVSGAIVTGAWSGAVGGTGTGVTGSDGKVVLTSPNIKSGNSVTFTVTNVTHSNFTYDSAANVETSILVTKL